MTKKEKFDKLDKLLKSGNIELVVALRDEFDDVIYPTKRFFSYVGFVIKGKRFNEFYICNTSFYNEIEFAKEFHVVAYTLAPKAGTLIDIFLRLKTDPIDIIWIYD